jgi:hypothetical protein
MSKSGIRVFLLMAYETNVLTAELDCLFFCQSNVMMHPENKLYDESYPA